MSNRYGLVLPGVITLAAAVGQLFAVGGGWFAALTGLALVVGGTLFITLVSHSAEGLKELRHTLIDHLRERRKGSESPIRGVESFLYAADCYRRGEIRRAEEANARVGSPMLRRGAQLVVDGFPRDQIHLALQRELAHQREQLRRPVELLRAMAGYAPAFGMIGTLFGLVQMLFGLGDDDLGAMGSAMGFAMLTTVYGLVLANLVFRPAAAKLEQSARRSLASGIAQFQAVVMLMERQHSSLIREMLKGSPLAPPASAASPAGLRLVASR